MKTCFGAFFSLTDETGALVTREAIMDNDKFDSLSTELQTKELYLMIKVYFNLFFNSTLYCIIKLDTSGTKVHTT
jgi:hypothetical protein